MSEAAQTDRAPLLVQRDGPVAILRLNVPDRLNALTKAMRDQLAIEIPALIDDPGCRVILITGVGRGFCAGGAMNERSDLRATATRSRLGSAHGAWIRRMISSDTVVVTAVNGAAVGAGFGLALMGDIVLASREAYFKAGFPSMGAAPDYAVGWTLPRAVGANRAREILLTNRRVPAEEAERIGLVSRLVDPERLEAEALELCHSLAAGPYSLGLAKTMVRKAYELSIDEFLELEAFSQGMAFSSEDFHAGKDAFQVKQKPAFKGL
jgi:2-(1,2-epoxy-1,2-dihydrophenyl)acetyl-CoA isomerase